MLYPNYTGELIGLKDLCVKSMERIGQKLYIHAGMYQRIHKCPHCKERTSKVHDYRTQQIKDISAFGEMVVICLRKRRQVQYVVIDMSGPYKSLAKSLFSHAKIIADRYHVIRPACYGSILIQARQTDSCQRVKEYYRLCSIVKLECGTRNRNRWHGCRRRMILRNGHRMIRARIAASYTNYSLFVTELAADTHLARLSTDITKPASNLSITPWLE
jgi:transposase